MTPEHVVQASVPAVVLQQGNARGGREGAEQVLMPDLAAPPPAPPTRRRSPAEHGPPTVAGMPEAAGGKVEVHAGAGPA